MGVGLGGARQALVLFPRWRRESLRPAADRRIRFSTGRISPGELHRRPPLPRVPSSPPPPPRQCDVTPLPLHPGELRNGLQRSFPLGSNPGKLILGATGAGRANKGAWANWPLWNITTFSNDTSTSGIPGFGLRPSPTCGSTPAGLKGRIVALFFNPRRREMAVRFSPS